MEVIDAVRREAAESTPLLFPWFRFLVGLPASGATAAAGTVLLSQSKPALAAIAAPLAPLAAFTPELGYATAAGFVSLALASLPMVFDGP